MKYNDEIMFSTDRKKFVPARFVCAYPEINAVKIRLFDGDMSVRATEVFMPTEAEAVKVAAFYEENEAVINLWRTYKKGKPRIAREASSSVSAVYRILRQAQAYGIVSDVIKETVTV